MGTEGKFPCKKVVFKSYLKSLQLLEPNNSQDVRRRGSRGDGHRQWIRHGQGRFRRGRRSPRRLSLRRRQAKVPWSHGRHGQQRRLRRRRGSVQERYPLFEVPHRARHRDQLGRHGEDLAPHLQQRVENLSTPRLTGRRWSRSFSRPLTPQPPTCASRPSFPSTLPVAPPVSSSTSAMASPTPSPSTRVTPFPTPSCVSTWPVAT